VFDKGVFTPNDQHHVSWHWASEIDVGTFRLTVRGHVNPTLSLDDLLHGMPRVELAAVNQCAGNSRIYIQPRVPGAQWANGSMSNALWGVPTRQELLLGANQFFQHVRADVVQPPAGLGERHATPMPIEKLRLQFGFKVAQVPAEGGLGDAEPHRGATEASQIGDLDKVSQPGEIHRRLHICYSSYNPSSLALLGCAV